MGNAEYEEPRMLIGNDFITVFAVRSCRCSECGKTIRKGEHCLESHRFGKLQKRVCSEDCRLAFDDHFWQGKADDREARHG